MNIIIPQRALLCALDLLYLGVTIENMCQRHERAPGHHYQYMDTKVEEFYFFFKFFQGIF